MTLKGRIIRAADGGTKVSGILYGGGPIKQFWVDLPLIIDLDGMAIPPEVPLLNGHINEVESRLGVIRARAVLGELHFDGEILSESSAAKEIISQGKLKADWQASQGTEIQEIEEVPEGETRTINGDAHSGPFYHVAKSLLLEGSVVPIGADTSTRMRVAASCTFLGGTSMKTDFEKWLETQDIADLTPERQAVLKAAYEKGDLPKVEPTDTPATIPDPVPDPAPQVQAAAQPPVTPAPTISAADAITAERERIAAVQDLCAGEFPEIEKEAIRAGHTPEQVSPKVLAALREKRPSGDAGFVGARSPEEASGAVIEAAMIQATGKDAGKYGYTAETQDAAHKNYPGGMSLQEMLIITARRNGYHGRGVFRGREIENILRAAFSNMAANEILENVQNKFLNAGYEHVEDSWKKICKIGSVQDFKQAKRYTFYGDFQFKKVAPGGEITHATVGDDSYTIQADTEARMYVLTRTDLINDDMGAFEDIPRMIGRGAAQSINHEVWTEFLADAGTFWTVARGNYASGAATALDVDALTTAETMFFDQTDPKSKPLGVEPAILLVPNALNVTASGLMKSLEVRPDGSASAKKVMTRNPHAGKFEVVRSSFLGNASYGNSNAAWFLLADPQDLAVIEIAFLNGQQTPIVERTTADFTNLGIQFRGYFDFGTNKQEYRGGVKMKGEA